MKRAERDDWRRDLDARQRNVEFPDTAANEARFWRNIISGKEKLRPSQVAGIALICFTLAAAIYSYISFQLRVSGAQGTLWERILGTFGDWLILFAVAAAVLLVSWLVRRWLKLYRSFAHSSRKH